MNLNQLPTNSLVLLLDADSISYSITHQLREWDDVNLANSVINDYMIQLYQQIGASHACVFLGGIGNFRYQVAKTKPYKGQRKELSERDKIWKQYITEYLVNHWGAQRCDGIEADDAVSISVTQLRELGINYLICSNDKDVDTVSGNHYSMNKRTFYHITENQASLLLHTQYITGDTTDNIPGLPGKGKVYADRLLSDKLIELHTQSVQWAYSEHAIGSPLDRLDYFEEQKTLLTLLKTHESFVPFVSEIDKTIFDIPAKVLSEIDIALSGL